MKVVDTSDRDVYFKIFMYSIFGFWPTQINMEPLCAAQNELPPPVQYTATEITGWQRRDGSSRLPYLPILREISQLLLVYTIFCMGCLLKRPDQAQIHSAPRSQSLCQIF